MMTVLSFKHTSRSLYIFIAVLAIVNKASATTCNERIDDLEGIVRSLKEKLENEIGVKQKVEDLEVALVVSNRRIGELEAKVSELTFFEQSSKTKPLATPTNNINGIKADTGLILANFKTRSKIKYPLWGENKTPEGILKVFVQSNHSKMENHKIYTHATAAGGQPMKIGAEKDKLRKKEISNGNTSIHSPRRAVSDGAAFSAYVSVHATSISNDYTIKFDTTVTNFGNHYNPFSGVFTASQHGVYVFTWNLYCGDNGGFIFSQLVVNSDVVGAMYTDSTGADYVRTTTGVVVVEINNGDIVFVRIHPTNSHKFGLYSHTDWRSTFSGWKLY